MAKGKYMSVRIGVIGLGEVGSIFSKALSDSGATVLVFDILLNQQNAPETLAQKGLSGRVQFKPLSDVVGESECILSMVTTQVALKVAAECRSFLKPGQIYLDLNSTSPAVKKQICKVIEPSGAAFVEGAILGAVGATGAMTRILTCGNQGAKASGLLSALGMRISFYSNDIGQASMFKMLRSIFSKGLEALILELMVAGTKAGIEKDLWEDVVELMRDNPFDRTAANWVRSHAVAFERRFHEMEQVLETMLEIGVDPMMSAATRCFFKRSTQLGFKEAFPQKPDSVQAVVNHMARRLEEMKTR
jgi:3-hydroxyisobutyrate dehydrogenase-like beta-hydroxyacid dehydrogenase